MGCSNCSSQNGKPNGCRSNGSCSTGGCNRLNTFDWLATYDIEDPDSSDLVEVSFKQGAKNSSGLDPKLACVKVNMLSSIPEMAGMSGKYP